MGFCDSVTHDTMYEISYPLAVFGLETAFGIPFDMVSQRMQVLTITRTLEQMMDTTKYNLEYLRILAVDSAIAHAPNWSDFQTFPVRPSYIVDTDAAIEHMKKPTL